MTSQTSAPLLRTPSTGATALPDELQTALVRFVVALNRRRAYAATHPMVAQAETALFESMTRVLAQHPLLTLGVAHRELVVNQHPVVQGGATVRELAERLHRRGVGAMTLDAGLTPTALRDALAWLADDPTAPSAPSAPRGADTPPVLAGIAIAKVAYERLALTDDEGTTAADTAALWRSLAALALGDEDAADDLRDHADADVRDVSEAINRRASAPVFARRVGLVLQTIASQLRTSSPEVREEIAARLCSVFEQLSDSSFAAIIRSAGTAAEQRRYLVQLLEIMPVSAIVDWLEHAARATGQELSHHLLRILTKLAAHDGERRASAADPKGEFRATAQALVADWALDNPNPIEHGSLLDHIATRARDTAVSPGTTGRDRPPPEEISEDERDAPDEDAVRLVHMACEIDVAGADAVAAAEELVAAGHTVALLTWLCAAPGQRAAAVLREAVVAPSAVRRVLLREPFDPASARALLENADLTLAPTLLDILAEARNRSARRVLLNTLRGLGPELAPLLLPRLEARTEWYVTRNLLLLLRDVTSDASGTESAVASGTLLSFLDHAQEQVRIEALRLLVETSATRDPAIRRALDDRSERIVAAALDVLREVTQSGATTRPARPVSREVALRLVRLADSGTLSAEVRATAIRLLSGTPGPTVREWLLTHVQRRTRFLRRRTLADGPTVVAALGVLAATAGDDPLVTPVLDMARRLDARDARRLAVEAPRPAGTP